MVPGHADRIFACFEEVPQNWRYMPSGPFRSQVERFWRFADNIGLQQDWGVFSPNAREQSIDVYAIITYTDGSVVEWQVPEFDPVFGAYREYRWTKWQERVRLDSRADLWDPTAAWIAEQHRRDGELPATVELVRRWIDHEPLDADGAVDGDWNEFRYHVWSPPTAAPVDPGPELEE